MSCWWQREWRTKLVWHCIQWAWKSFSTVGEGWQPWCSIPNHWVIYTPDWASRELY
jgi:hypothetical protein